MRKSLQLNVTYGTDVYGFGVVLPWRCERRRSPKTPVSLASEGLYYRAKARIDNVY